MGKKTQAPKKRSWQIKLDQQIELNKQKAIADIQARCLPGQKVMTCSYCNRMGRYPDWQIMVTCVNFTHPGEILH